MRDNTLTSLVIDEIFIDKVVNKCNTCWCTSSANSSIYGIECDYEYKIIDEDNVYTIAIYTTIRDDAGYYGDEIVTYMEIYDDHEMTYRKCEKHSIEDIVFFLEECGNILLKYVGL